MQSFNWSSIQPKPQRLIQDHRHIQQGDCFIACAGERHDARLMIFEAIKNGATFVLWEQDDAMPIDPKQIGVPHCGVPALKAQLGHIIAAFYGHPSQNIWVAGVTGTNGKTSCSHWIAQLLFHLGERSAVIGTIGNGLIEHPLTATQNTTPGALELQQLFADYAHLFPPVNAIAMEVSSHGLTQGRVQGVDFNVAIFTNLSRDHLDYHQTVEHYKAAKLGLFAWPSLKFVILNQDDSVFHEFYDIAKNNPAQPHILTYSLTNPDADLFAHHIIPNGHYNTSFTLKLKNHDHPVLINSQLIGQFNIYNLLAVIASVLVRGYEIDKIAAHVPAIRAVSGRMESFGKIHTQPRVIVDYAHTPDALENVLRTLKQHLSTQTGKLYCVFGCGGDRDQGKRPLMGEIAAQHADFIYLTDDNPRSESSDFILQQIQMGIPQSAQERVLLIPDRKTAIETAIQQAHVGDIVLIAGKGHENYQEIQGIRHHFSDQEIVQACLSS